MIARIRVSVDATPVSEFDDVHATRQERISQLLSEQSLNPCSCTGTSAGAA
ncbi:hypothetical protein ACWDRB_08005 [Nonomuraea sp. NPDC003707]